MVIDVVMWPRKWTQRHVKEKNFNKKIIRAKTKIKSGKRTTHEIK